MVKSITPEDTPCELRGPLAGDFPLYLFLPEHRRYLLFSHSLRALLHDPRVKKPLKVSPIGISFILQSGAIPTPRTIFQNLWVLNIGDRVRITVREGRLYLDFDHEFPFFNARRDPEKVPDEDHLLRLLARAVLKRLKKDRPVYLFQSIGKDSNTIALALAEAGLRETICVTLHTGDRKDESELAAHFARKLGLRHRKLPVPENLSRKHIEALESFLGAVPLPCVDGTSLAYPFYGLILDFEGSNIIDGSGNDVYLGHVPRKIEYRRQKIYPYLTFLRPIADRLPTGNPLQRIAVTRCEMAGPWGFTYRDARHIFPEARPVFPYWKKGDQERKGWDYFDLKADVWGPNLEFELVMRKARNFAEVFGCNLIFPWADEEVAAYCARLPEKYLFDRRRFRNKLLLRKILKERLGLDSDALGKYSYGFDAFTFLQKIPGRVREEILSCPYWNRQGVEEVLNTLMTRIERHPVRYRRLKNLVVRLYILSAWLNRSPLVAH